MDANDILELVAHYGYVRIRMGITCAMADTAEEPEASGYRADYEALNRTAKYAWLDVKDALDGKKIPLPRV